MAGALRLVINPRHPEPRKIAMAAKIIDDGGVALYPTDTVYALGCAIEARRAIERIYRLRQIDAGHSLALICADVREASRYGLVTDFAYRQMRRILPGPYTVVLEATREVPKVLLDTAAAAVGEIEEMREFNRGLDSMVDDGKKKKSDDPAYDRLIGAENAARKLITDGKLAEARRAIPAIKGTAVGARARARLYAELCRAHKARGESADADTAAGAARVARDEVFFPGWRAKLGDC